MRVLWDQIGERLFETGVDRGVLFIPDNTGVYADGYAWNGLVSVTESPTGAESNPQYADNIMYLNLVSVERFGATIEAFTYPDEFGQCDGTATLQDGVTIGQQPRHTFGLCYRTKLGNDTENAEFGYKLHLVYGALAAPSERAYETINDSPAAITFSWDVTTTPVDVPGFKPSASMVIDSSKVDADALATLEDILYGTEGQDPRLPLPTEVLAQFSGTVIVATPTAPTFVSGTHTITIPSITGVIYKIGGVTKVPGAVVITEDTVVHAVPASGYKFPDVIVTEWFYDFV